MMDSTTITLFDNILKGVGRHPKSGKKKGGMNKLALMGECTGITFIDSTRIPVCENKREYSNSVFKGYAH